MAFIKALFQCDCCPTEEISEKENEPPKDWEEVTVAMVGTTVSETEYLTFCKECVKKQFDLRKIYLLKG